MLDWGWTEIPPVLAMASTLRSQNRQVKAISGCLDSFLFECWMRCVRLACYCPFRVRLREPYKMQLLKKSEFESTEKGSTVSCLTWEWRMRIALPEASFWIAGLCFPAVANFWIGMFRRTPQKMNSFKIKTDQLHQIFECKVFVSPVDQDGRLLLSL